MTRPGDRLRALAARVCSATTMERLIDPLIADLQCEHADAIRRGAVWRAHWIRLAGYTAFWKGLCMYSTARAANGIETLDEDRATWRLLGFVAAATMVVTVLLALFGLLQTGSPFRSERLPNAWLFLYLVPSTLPLTIPIGILFGILYAMRQRTVTRRARRATVVLAVCCTVGSFGLLAWIIPASNQAFRETVSGRPDLQFRGSNDLTFGELRQEMDRLNAGAMRGSVQERNLTFTYYMRFALSVVPIVFGLFAIGLLNVSVLQRSRLALGAVAVVACLGYYALLSASRTALLGGWAPAIVWLPNMIFMLATLATNIGRLVPLRQG